MPTSFEPGAPTPDGTIPLSSPSFGGNEWEYVKECLDTGWVSSVGSFVDRFEGAVAAYVGARHAVATVNGTAALHIALLVAGVQPGDEVLVSTLSFIAPANAIRYVGAWPVFVDAEPKYWQMSGEQVVDFLERRCIWRDGALHNLTTGRRIKAVVPVHILGHPVDMEPILMVAGKYDLAVIEDATESLGASYAGRRVGSLGDVACFSFNGNKLITTGGGGMLVTDSEVMANRARYLTTQAKDDPIEYVHGTVGYNYRLTNLQAAVGCAQMERLGDYVVAKRRHADAYRAALGGTAGLTLMPEAAWALSTYWMYTVLVRATEYGLTSRQLLQVLADHGIQSRPLWQPLHCSPAHAGAMVLGGSASEQLYAEALSLPCSVGLTADQLERVVSCLRI